MVGGAKGEIAHSNASFEDQRFMTRSLAISESANCLSALVFVGHEHIVEAFMAESLEKPFSALVRHDGKHLDLPSDVCVKDNTREIRHLHVGSWQFL